MNFDVFEYITKVFEYYKSLGVLEFSEITLPGSLPNDPVLTNLWMFDPDDPYNDNHDPYNQVWRNEEISVNDCFLKNANKYKYIINKDMDEMIVPLKENDYHEMMEMLEEITRNNVRTSNHLSIYPVSSILYVFRCFPMTFQMFSHTYRDVSPWLSKCFPTLFMMFFSTFLLY